MATTLGRLYATHGVKPSQRGQRVTFDPIGTFLKEVEQERALRTFESYRNLLQSYARDVPNLLEVEPEHIRQWVHRPRHEGD